VLGPAADRSAKNQRVSPGTFSRTGVTSGTSTGLSSAAR